MHCGNNNNTTSKTLQEERYLVAKIDSDSEIQDIDGPIGQ